ncbi:uncharacterized protein LOC116669345 [Camelus ferus]|uniref:Uncharacterized protein LOC116669345 n=1 Tax=Camelus ferus TaxID=419612 RepID=A0A8B8UK86_CAMFR|nr:uncharacterized protein LOC116669345 [Camelus ferus]
MTTFIISETTIPVVPRRAQACFKTHNSTVNTLKRPGEGGEPGIPAPTLWKRKRNYTEAKRLVQGHAAESNSRDWKLGLLTPGPGPSSPHKLPPRKRASSGEEGTSPRAQATPGRARPRPSVLTPCDSAAAGAGYALGFTRQESLPADCRDLTPEEAAGPGHRPRPAGRVNKPNLWALRGHKKPPAGPLESRVSTKERPNEICLFRAFHARGTIQQWPAVTGPFRSV